MVSRCRRFSFVPWAPRVYRGWEPKTENTTDETLVLPRKRPVAHRLLLGVQMGRCIQLVMGPAGSGKSTYCSALQEHCKMLGRTIQYVEEEPPRSKPDRKTQPRQAVEEDRGGRGLRRGGIDRQDMTGQATKHQSPDCRARVLKGVPWFALNNTFRREHDVVILPRRRPLPPRFSLSERVFALCVTQVSRGHPFRSYRVQQSCVKLMRQCLSRPLRMPVSGLEPSPPCRNGRRCQRGRSTV